MGVVKSFPQDELHIHNCTKFCDEVEALITTSNRQADDREANSGRKSLRIGYIESVLAVAEKRKIEPDMAANYLNPQIKEKLRIEYEDRHMMKRTAKLPF